MQVLTQYLKTLWLPVPTIYPPSDVWATEFIGCEAEVVHTSDPLLLYFINPYPLLLKTSWLPVPTIYPPSDVWATEFIGCEAEVVHTTEPLLLYFIRL